MPKWVTVHPVYEKGNGRHVLIDNDGTVLAGMGGKFNGHNIYNLKQSPSQINNTEMRRTPEKKSRGKLKHGHIKLAKPIPFIKDQGLYKAENYGYFPSKSISISGKNIVGMEPTTATEEGLKTTGNIYYDPKRLLKELEKRKNEEVKKKQSKESAKNAVFWLTLPEYLQKINDFGKNEFAHYVNEITKQKLSSSERIDLLYKKLEDLRKTSPSKSSQAKDTHILTYDRTESVRTFDDDGRLRVEITPISKANICEYLGSEIPGYEELGLRAEKRYRLLRDPDELAKAVDTFNLIPILEDHVPTSAASHPREATVGSTADNAAFEAPYLKVGLVIFDGAMIEKIQSGKQREISCGYKYTPDMTPGTYEGQPYDGRMTNIIGNHVALVEEGRAGPDVLVNDKAKVEHMADIDENLTKIVEALRPLIGKQSDDEIREKVLALISQGDSETSNSGTQTEDEETNIPVATPNSDKPETAKDDEQTSNDNPEEKSDDSLTEDDEDYETEEKKKHEINEAINDKIRAALAADRARYRGVEAAKNMVRPLVGDIYGMDSAAQIYRYTLTQSGMAMDSLKGVNEAGLRALIQFKLEAGRASVPVIAQDSSTLGFTPPRQL